MRRRSATWLLVALLCLSTLLPIVSPVGSRQFRPKVALTSGDSAWRGSRDDCANTSSRNQLQKERVVVIKPVLTTTPYSARYTGSDSFYSFYVKYKNTTKGEAVGTDLDWLRTPVSAASKFNDGWGTMLPVFKFMSGALTDSCGNPGFSVLSDVDVDGGSLFSDGTRKYDVAVLGKSEYVTSGELAQLTQFASSGGRLVLMDSDDFQVEVKLGLCPTLCEFFVNGHGWTSTGQAVHTQVWNAFPGADASLIGSALPEQYFVGAYIGPGTVSYRSAMGSLLYQTFGQTVLQDYVAHEENRLVNLTGTSVLISFQFGISSMIHRFGHGDVVCFCLEGSRLISTEPVARYFLIASIRTWGSTGATGVTAVLGESRPQVDVAGGWMTWMNESPVALKVHMFTTAVNAEGQTVAVGESAPVTIPPSGTAAMEVRWGIILPSLKGLEVWFFVVTDSTVPVSVEVEEVAYQFAGE